MTFFVLYSLGFLVCWISLATAMNVRDGKVSSWEQMGMGLILYWTGMASILWPLVIVAGLIYFSVKYFTRLVERSEWYRSNKTDW